MVRLETRTRSLDGLTLVEGRLHNDAGAAVRVTLATEVDPVFPPRSGGEPVDGWRPAAERLSVVLGPGQRTGVGFASPADPGGSGESPLAVVETERHPETGGLPSSPAGVARALGDPLPPAAAVETRPRGQGPTAGGDRRSRPSVGQDLERLRRAAIEVTRAATSLERRLGEGGRSGGFRERGQRRARR